MIDNQSNLHVIESDAEKLGIIGRSEAISSLIKKIKEVSNCQNSVLITGERGVGKELVAHAIHRIGFPKEEFIKVDCAGIPESLYISELLGSASGAFTGSRLRKGYVNAADKGVLFLDEIGDLSQLVQGVLLNVVEYGEVSPLGTEITKNVKVKFVSATNKDLGAMIDEGKFRSDLFDRLNVLTIHVPPLRERMEDVPLLAKFFFKTCANGEDPADSLGEAAIKEFVRRAMEYDWPGNVRELKSAVIRTLAHKEIFVPGGECKRSVIEPIEKVLNGDVKEALDLFSPSISLDEAVIRLRETKIREALISCKFNKLSAAKRLKITRGRLMYFIKKSDIE